MVTRHQPQKYVHCAPKTPRSGMRSRQRSSVDIYKILEYDFPVFFLQANCGQQVGMLVGVSSSETKHETRKKRRSGVSWPFPANFGSSGSRIGFTPVSASTTWYVASPQNGGEQLDPWKRRVYFLRRRLVLNGGNFKNYTSKYVQTTW